MGLIVVDIRVQEVGTSANPSTASTSTDSMGASRSVSGIQGFKLGGGEWRHCFTGRR